MALRIGTQGEQIAPAKKSGTQTLQTGSGGGQVVDRSGTAPAGVAYSAPIVDYTGGGSSGGGGGGGGGASAAAATAAAARPSLTDYIQNNYLRKQAEDEANRRLGEFDSDTLRQRGLVAADQSLRRHSLQQNLDDQGLANAESMAGRGLLRSGLTFQNQDRINQYGNEQRGIIDQLMSNFEAQRAGQRQQQEAANRQAIADAIAKITDQYATTYGANSIA